MNERGRIGLAKHFAAEADVALHDSHRIRSLLVDSVHASEPRAVDLFEADAVEEAAAQDEP
jgi:hypothetical protein